MTFPDFAKIASGFGIEHVMAAKSVDCKEAIKQTLSTPGLVVCEVRLDMNQLFEPRLSSRKLPNGDLVSSPLEDMAPFLPRPEFEAEMIIPPLAE